jgi:hypothetical protein
MSDVSQSANLPAIAGGPAVPVTINDPAQSDDNFIAEFAVMDLAPLKGNTYLVSVSTGDRNKGKFLTSTIRGPYDFLEMVQEVGFMYEQHQHHAKATIAEKDRMKPVRYLDQKTIDYIEAHYQNIIADSVLEEILGGNPNYTHAAGIIETKPEDDVIIAAAIEAEKAKQAAALPPALNEDDEDL